MKFSGFILQFTVAVLASVSCIKSAAVTKDKRQINHGGNVNTEQDREVAETGLASAALAGGKYFQDFFTGMLAPHKIEFGHVCESPDDWEQRFERKDFKTHHHQGKVRWGDKHGGYGEHYWDYNHDGHDHDGEGSENEAQYAQYEATEDKPKYAQLRNKREPKFNTQDVEFIDERSRFLSEAGLTGRHGGNYRRHPGTERAKRQHNLELSDLVYEPTTGKIIDQNSGNIYELTPVS